MRLCSARQRNRAGTALFTVMMLTFVLSAGAAVLASAGLSRAFMATKLADRVRAGALAEAGVSYAYTVLSTNFNARTNSNAFSPTSYGNGTYDVQVLAVEDHAAVIQCSAQYGTGSELVILDIVHLPGEEGSGGGGGASYDCMILAEGTVTWTGCGVFNNGGLVHGNAQFKQSGCGELNTTISSSHSIVLNGASGHIGGDAYAPTVRGKTSKVWGTIYEQPVALRSIPELDLTPYYNAAAANGQVYSGNVGLSHDFTPPGGIMWVNGNLNISGTMTLTGCFIATGDIKIAGGGFHHKFGNYPGFVSRDGDIKHTGSKEIEGLVYARIGDVAMAGGGSLSGCIQCGGNFKKSGCSTVFSFDGTAPTPPGGNDGAEAIAVVTWQR